MDQQSSVKKTTSTNQQPGIKRLARNLVLPLLLVSLLHAEPAPRAISPSRPAADRAGAFLTHHYRNLFAEDGHPQPEIDQKLQLAYAQLFHGDPQTQSVYFDAGRNANGSLAYLTDWNNHDVRTEGLSYGMMIAVQLNHQHDFDALWNWAMTYLYTADPKHPNYRFFAWSAKTDGTLNSETAAPDGEEYFAMALYFASARWGDGHGIYDYHSQADTLLRAMLHRERIVGPTRFGIRDEANELNPGEHMIRFVPDSFGSGFTDPSYHLPAFYELWARWGPPEDRSFWRQAAQTSRAFFRKTTNPHTGLAPVYANFDGTPHPTRFPQSGLFGADAWRTVSNWSVDWSWFHADPQEPLLSDRLQAFFLSQGPQYGQYFALDGTPMTAPDAAIHSPGLAAVNAVAGLAANDRTHARTFTEALWAESVPSGQYRYYDGMLYLLSYLHVSGAFQIYTPAWAAGRAK